MQRFFIDDHFVAGLRARHQCPGVGHAVTLVRGEASRQKTVRIAAPRERPDRGW
jgi:uncharacterized protein YggU (UPF0235/DUF167 family)